MAELSLLVNGRKYGGWKSVRVTRSIETMAGSFNLEASDRWAEQEVPWPIAEEDACRVEIDGFVVIDGYVGKRNFALAGTQRSLAFSGKDRAAALVECDAILDKWSFRDTTILEVARKVAAPFGVRVTQQPGLVLPKLNRKLVVNPGDTPFQVIQSAGAIAGVLAVSDGAGGVVLTRAGTARCGTPLVEGENVVGASVEFDAEERFHRYVVVTQVAGTDEAPAEHTRIRAEAIDQGVRRTNRVKLIRPETGVSVADARKRADWEARIRAAHAETVTVVVEGWTQPRGGLWPINALVPVHIPSIGIVGDLLISQADHSLSNDGESTQFRLVRPDAFTPEPRAVVKPTVAWKELAGGGHPPAGQAH